MTCELCGLELMIGMYPFCHSDPLKHVIQASSVVGDELVGGFVQEHFGHQPEVFYSKKAMAKRADSLGLEPMVRWSGPNDRHVTRWSSVDLEAAKALVSRQSAARDPEVVAETFQYTAREVK